TLELKRKWLGSENPETLDTMTNLAEFYRVRGEYDKAEPLTAAALAAYRRVLGVSHPSTINSMNSLGELYVETGKYPQAEALFQEAFDSARNAGRENHPFALASLYGVAEAMSEKGTPRGRKASTRRYWKAGGRCLVTNIRTRSTR